MYINSGRVESFDRYTIVFIDFNTSIKIIKNGSRDRVHLGLHFLGSGPMPVSCEILTVSDSDGEDNREVPRNNCKLRSRNGSRHKRKCKLVTPLDQETRLRCVLGKPCWCKQGQCLQHFVPDHMFWALLDYRTSLFSLHKIDQDHCVFGLTTVVGYLFFQAGYWVHGTQTISTEPRFCIGYVTL